MVVVVILAVRMFKWEMIGTVYLLEGAFMYDFFFAKEEW